MQTNIQEFLKNEKLPKFLVEHKKLNSISKVSKVFPSIGLPNCSETCKFDNTDAIKQTAEGLIILLIDTMYSRFSNAAYRHNQDVVGQHDKLNRLVYWRTITGKIRDHHYYNKSYINVDIGKVSLKLSGDIVDIDGNVIFRKDESLFRVYNKIYEVSKSERLGVRLPKLDTIDLFKQFSTENMPSKDYNIVFSSNGLDGLWDIATMSMRGIKSCQSWNGRFKSQLVGSLVDPCVGIIYITTGKDINNLGSKMIKRCIVRYAINSESKKPIIIIDKMYPSHDEKAGVMFYDFIKNKTDNKIDIKIWPFRNDDYKVIRKTYLPDHPIRKKLTKRTKSYMDTPMLNKEHIEGKSQLAINIHNRDIRFSSMLVNVEIRMQSIKQINISSITKNNHMKAGLKKIVNTAGFQFFIQEYYDKVSKKIIDSVSKTEFYSSDEYMKRLCFAFLTKKYTKQITLTLVREINKYYKLPKEKRINSEVFNKLLMPVQTMVSNNVKSQLKQLLTPKPAAVNL